MTGNRKKDRIFKRKWKYTKVVFRRQIEKASRCSFCIMQTFLNKLQRHVCAITFFQKREVLPTHPQIQYVVKKIPFCCRKILVKINAIKDLRSREMGENHDFFFGSLCWFLFFPTLCKKKNQRFWSIWSSRTMWPWKKYATDSTNCKIHHCFQMQKPKAPLNCSVIYIILHFILISLE